MSLKIVSARGELLEQWRAVHNNVNLAVQLTAEEVAERAFRHHLTLAYIGGVLVGNATVRAPDDGGVTAIVRILPAYRRRGLGSEYLEAIMKQVRSSHPDQINTIVLAANLDGLTFAQRHGFVETERYEIEGVAYIGLTRHDTTSL
jgi:GNAT superfamily N-acetyltransferase